MTKWQRISLFLGVFLPAYAYSDDPSSFYVERNVVERIFSDSTAPNEHRSSSTSFTPSVGMHMPGNLRVANRYFETDYARDVSGIPFIQARLTRPLWQINSHLSLDGGLAAGYGYRQSTVMSKDSSGQRFQDSFDIQWTNVEGAADLAIELHPIIKPSIQLGFGNAWIHQVGSLDGVDQSVSIQYLTVGTALGVQASNQLAIQATAKYELGLGQQTYQGWTLTLGTMVSI